MPVFFEHNINQSARLVVWKLEEDDSFFLSKLPFNPSINHTQKRLQHLCGRFLLQYLFHDFPYNELIIDDFGKPALKNQQYHFSISHSKDYVAAIVSKYDRVGIDIEMVQIRALKVISKFLSDDEQYYLKIDNEKYATLYWSIKEAIYKCYGYDYFNFKESISLLPFNINENKVKAILNQHKQIEVYYQFLNNIVLSWTYCS